MDSDDQNSGVMMECMTGSDNGATERFYGRVEEIWELDYSGLHNTTIFRVRWAKSVLKEDRYFTTMVIPEFHHHGYTRSQIQDRGRKRHREK